MLRDQVSLAFHREYQQQLDPKCVRTQISTVEDCIPDTEFFASVPIVYLLVI